MFIPKEHRVAIYEYLFKEGVMLAVKDFYAPNHADLGNVPNLHVIKTMQSLKSKNFVRENFVWRHYYWYLTNEGIEYLRAYLHLSSELVPSTLMPRGRSDPLRARARAKPRSYGSASGKDRQEYRFMQQSPQPGPVDKKEDVGAGAGHLEFLGGLGHGKRV